MLLSKNALKLIKSDCKDFFYFNKLCYIYIYYCKKKLYTYIYIYTVLSVNEYLYEHKNIFQNVDKTKFYITSV